MLLLAGGPVAVGAGLAGRRFVEGEVLGRLLERVAGLVAKLGGVGLPEPVGEVEPVVAGGVEVEEAGVAAGADDRGCCSGCAGAAGLVAVEADDDFPAA